MSVSCNFTLGKSECKQPSLQFLGFNSEAIIYINEQWLKEHYLMKKHKVLTAVFTRRGLVHVRCTRREGVFCINSMKELSFINHSPDPLSTSLTNASAGPEADSFRTIDIKMVSKSFT